MHYSVARHIHWATGNLIVEINVGGIDYDVLPPIYDGEGVTYDTCGKAVEAAIRIAEAWKRSEKRKIYITVSSTDDIVLPFEMEQANKKTYKRLRKLAKEIDKGVERCRRCGDILRGDNRWGHALTYDEYPFCSTACADMDYYERTEPVDSEVRYAQRSARRQNAS